MLYEVVNAISKTLGVVIVPNWRITRLDEERHLGRLLRHLDVDCVFDVGANVGQFGTMLRKYIGYRDLILSFEPNPEALKLLKKAAFRDKRWHIEPVALGSNFGTAKFQAYEQSVFGSIRKFGASKHSPKHMPSKTIEVPMRTLESYVGEAKRRWGFKRPFLKLDTQGFDLEVAKGAGQTLSEFVGLQSEIAFQTIYEGAPDYLSALNFFETSGFVISRLVPIHEAHFPQLVEMDVIMVRSDLA